MPYSKEEQERINEIDRYYTRRMNLHTKMMIYKIPFPEKRNIGGLREFLELGEKGIFVKTCEEIEKDYWDEIERRILAYEAENNKAA